MISVKVYDTDTGHTQVINRFQDDQTDLAQHLLSGLNTNDHGTETVFYVSTDPEYDWGSP